MLIELNQDIITDRNDLKQHIELPDGLRVDTINVDYLPDNVKKETKIFIDKVKQNEYVCVYYKNLFCFIENTEDNFSEVRSDWNV